MRVLAQSGGTVDTSAPVIELESVEVGRACADLLSARAGALRAHATMATKRGLGEVDLRPRSRRLRPKPPRRPAARCDGRASSPERAAGPIVARWKAVWMDDTHLLQSLVVADNPAIEGRTASDDDVRVARR